MAKGKKGPGARGDQIRDGLNRLHQHDFTGAAGTRGQVMGDLRALVGVEESLAVVYQEVGCGAEEPVELIAQAHLKLAHLSNACGAVRARLEMDARRLVDLAIGGGNQSNAA
jgi:hypothetical protein